MKIALDLRFTRLLSVGISFGLLCCVSTTAGESKSESKSSKRSTTKIRAQNSDSQIVVTAATVSDEEIFDRDISTSSGSCVPHFSNGMTQPPSPFDTPKSSDPSGSNYDSMLNRPLPNSDPNSVFAQDPNQSPLPAPVTSLAAGQGASTAMSSVPSFMGDFFGGAPITITPFPTSNYSYSSLSKPMTVPSSTGVGIMKLAENTSPLPRDRVFLSYNYFSNVNLAPGGIDVNRMTPGIEKTFFGGNASVELRAPMAFTAGSTTTLDGSGSPLYNSNQYEFGNLTTYLKALLYRDEQFAFSTGLGVAAPTANDIKVNDASGNGVIRIRNQAWHLMPFLGSVYTPNNQWYAQSMVQFDFAANGNSVATEAYPGGPLAKNGSLNDPTYLFASLGTGYWLYQNPSPDARLSKVSLISELHFNTTLQSTDTVRGNANTVGTVQSQIQTLNAVVGTNIMLDQSKSLMLGYVAPLGASDQAFSGEFRVLFNWYFGPYQSRATRVQF